MSNRASPFPFASKTKPVEIDPEMLAVEHSTPMPRFRSRQSDKYGPIFSKLKPGSCVRCEPAETAQISQALRKCLYAGKYPALVGCKVSSRARCDDGHGRVWAIQS